MLARVGTFRGFTLIETMLAVLLLALLASAAALSFSRPIAAARLDDAVELVHVFDANTRIAARNGHGSRLTLNLATNTLERRDGAERAEATFATPLPTGCRIAAVRIGPDSVKQGEVDLDVSALGLSRSYAVQLAGPTEDRWLVFAGLSGEMVTVADESTVSNMLLPQTR
jgi:prepilin-type N-terminal cleavage/methylation domain-containing protein